MEEKNDVQTKTRNGITNGMSPPMPAKFSWHVNISSIDLSDQNIITLDEEVQFPSNLLELNLSHNKLHEVPAVVSKLEKLKCLNLSHNEIQCYDETPNFCHTLELLDLCTNNLHRPPYWIWKEKPKYLTYLNLSCNTQLSKTLENKYVEELLQYKTRIKHVDIYNCGFRTKDTELLATFQNAKVINFGTKDYRYGANVLNEAPSKGLEQCSQIERLNLSNTHIYTIDSSIEKLKNIRELNLSCNNLSGLPNEFCNLSNLEICVLSVNSIIYLPDDMYKLVKLRRLCIDCNKLCMIPAKLSEIPDLKVLDLYDNCLYEILEDLSHVEEIDVALNYMDEPDDDSYMLKKEKLRLQSGNRGDGRKPDEDEPERESINESDDEEFYNTLLHGETTVQEPLELNPSRSSSPEDWDSDAHWIPHEIRLPSPSTQPWIYFIQQKLREGNFCPIDAHVVSVSEQVMYEKKLNPQREVVCEGQFDDYSSDDS